MKLYTMEQGSREWVNIRLGKPTASSADKFLTPSFKPSASRDRYRIELLTEWLLGFPLEHGSTGFMDRGRNLEPEARSWYALTRDVEVQPVGFIERDDGLCGASPDGLVGSDGMTEIKCLSALNHVRALLGESEHYGQCQFQMYVAERAWVDLIFYNSVLKAVVHRVPRDDKYIKLLTDVLDPFIEHLENDKKRLAEYRIAA